MIAARTALAAACRPEGENKIAKGERGSELIDGVANVRGWEIELPSCVGGHEHAS